MEYIDTAKHIGKVWNKTQGWVFPPFPDVPYGFIALAVHPLNQGWETEDKLKELGFEPSFRVLGMNDPYDKKDPSSLVFFIRKYRENDEACNQDILSLIQGGISPKAICTITHRMYRAIVQQPRDDKPKP